MNNNLFHKRLNLRSHGEGARTQTFGPCHSRGHFCRAMFQQWSQTPLIRRSARLELTAANAAPSHHRQLRPAPINNSNSLEAYRRSWRIRIPQVRNNLNYEEVVLRQQKHHIKNFIPLRKQLLPQRHIMTTSAKKQ